MSDASTDALIDRLAADLRPVRPLPGPGWMLLRWILAATAAVAAVAWIEGARTGADLAAFDLGHLAAASATSIAAALAAFLLAAPGRDLRPAWLLAPAAALWAGHLGLGCLADWRDGTDGFRISWTCLGYIGGVGTLLSMIMLRLTRHAAAFRPGPVAAAAALSAAAAASAGLTLLHPTHGPLMVLAWHGLGAAVLAIGTIRLARPAWRRLA